MSNNKYIPLPGGKECRPVNPYPKWKSASYKDEEPTNEWQEFEDSAPTFQLTEVMPEGVEFEGEILKFKGKPPLTPIRLNEDVRIAIKPIKAIEPVEDISKLKADYANAHKQDASPNVVEKIKVNCLHAECPNCGHKVDVTPAEGTYIDKAVNVVENKEESFVPDLRGMTENEAYLHGVISGQRKRIEQLEQSQSIEGIVGFVLEFKHKVTGDIIKSAQYSPIELLETNLETIQEKTLDCDCKPTGENQYKDCNCDDYYDDYEFNGIIKEYNNGK